MKILKFTIFTLLINAGLAYSQTETSDFQTWSDLSLSFSLNNKLSLGGDMGIRGLISRNNWNQLYIRPSLAYSFNRTIKMSLGAAYFYTSSDIVQNVREIRFFQQADFSWPRFELVAFKHRIRFEERFFAYGDQKVIKSPGSDYELRTRYQIALESADFRLFNDNNYLFFITRFEAFIHFNERAVEQAINNTRITFGFGHRIGNSFRYEVHYIFQKSRLLVDEGLSTTENVLRVRFFIDGKRKAKVQNP